MGIFLVALPNTCYIANLMLANNICDLEEDENNKEIYISSLPWQSKFFEIIRRIKYNSNVSHFVSCRFRIDAANNVTHALTLPFVRKQTQALLKEQVKSKTFVCAVKILAVGATAQVLFFAIGLWWL